MMELTPEQKAELEAQKEQCIFCQIIKGKIPAKKVYEDKTILAILDINPSTKGHTLVIPKEHYPIMPLIPPDLLKEIFTKTKQITHSIKEAILVKDAIVFIANGAAAGQQSPHFLLHIIPKDSSSDAVGISIPKKEKGEDIEKELKEKTAPLLNAMSNKYLSEMGYIKQKETHPTTTTPQSTTQKAKFSKEKLIQVLKATPGLLECIRTDPEGFKKAIPSNPQLAPIFREFDIDDIVSEIEKDIATGKKETKKTTDDKKTDLDAISNMFK
jgi:histidine triad (HIT) family protein